MPAGRKILFKYCCYLSFILKPRVTSLDGEFLLQEYGIPVLIIKQYHAFFIELLERGIRFCENKGFPTLSLGNVTIFNGNYH